MTISTTSGHRRTGKIARLPIELQETVNRLLQDGVPYAAILARLGEQGKGINYHSLKRWRKGGHQDWLRARERVEIARLLQETVPAAKLPDALAHQTLLQLIQYLVDLQSTSEASGSRPPVDTVVRVANAICRLNSLQLPPGTSRS